MSFVHVLYVVMPAVFHVRAVLLHDAPVGQCSETSGKVLESSVRAHTIALLTISDQTKIANNLQTILINETKSWDLTN